jgi:hypothetical protein
MDMFSFTRFCLRVLADLNEIIRRMKRNVILTIAIVFKMPIQIKYINGGIGVEFIASGVVTGTDIIAANKEIYREENLLIQRYQIVDRTQCTEYEVSTKEIRIIAEQDIAAATINPNIIIAFISKTDLQYGISRMYQAYVGDSGFLTGLFRDRKSAEEWIKTQLKKSNNGTKPERGLGSD